MLSDVQQAQLWQVLQSPPPDGGLWNGRKVADWIAQLIGRPVSRQRGWEYLRQMTFRLRVPRPHHEEADPIEQQDWKKKLVQQVKRVQSDYPEAEVESVGNGMNIRRTQPWMLRVWIADWCSTFLL
jgi:hypothetical protein